MTDTTTRAIRRPVDHVTYLTVLILVAAAMALLTGCVFDDPAMQAQHDALVAEIERLTAAAGDGSATLNDLGRLVDAKLELARLAEQAPGIDLNALAAFAGAVATNLGLTRLWRGSVHHRRGKVGDA